LAIYDYPLTGAQIYEHSSAAAGLSVIEGSIDITELNDSSNFFIVVNGIAGILDITESSDTITALGGSFVLDVIDCYFPEVYCALETGFNLDCLIPELDCEILTYHTLTTSINCFVPELNCNIIAEVTNLALLDCIVPAVYCDIQGHSRFYLLECIVPEIYCDIRINSEISYPVLVFPAHNLILPVEDPNAFPEVYCDIQINAGPSGLLAFERGVIC